MKKRAPWVKSLSFITAAISWVELLPAGILYINFYPATKTLIKAGTNPWLHSILMETKEHWGLLLPIVATVAFGLVVTKETEESKRWWKLLIVLVVLIAVLGRLIKMGATL